MPDEATGAATTIPTPDPAPTPAPPASTEATTPETAPGGPSATPTPDPKAWLDTADAKELRGHKRIAGIVGEMVQAERSRIESDARARARWEYEQEQTRRDAERQKREADEALLRDLEDKPLDAAERVRQDILKRHQQEEMDRLVQQRIGEREPTIRQETLTEHNQALAAWATEHLPAPILARFQEKQYEGSYNQQAAAWWTDVWNETLRLERGKWEREATPALEKEALARLNGNEPVPDTEAGRPTGGELTLESWKAMSAEERRKLPTDRVDRMTRRLTKGVA